jgi:hypothetical protein
MRRVQFSSLNLRRVGSIHRYVGIRATSDKPNQSTCLHDIWSFNALYVLIAVPQLLFRPRRFCHFVITQGGDVKSGRRYAIKISDHRLIRCRRLSRDVNFQSDREPKLSLPLDLGHVHPTHFEHYLCPFRSIHAGSRALKSVAPSLLFIWVTICPSGPT